MYNSGKFQRPPQQPARAVAFPPLPVPNVPERAPPTPAAEAAVVYDEHRPSDTANVAAGIEIGSLCTVVNSQTPAQNAFQDGAAACTAISLLFGVFALDSSDVTRVDLRETIRLGGVCWKKWADRQSDPLRAGFVYAEEMLNDEAFATMRQVVRPVAQFEGSVPLFGVDATVGSQPSVADSTHNGEAQIRYYTPLAEAIEQLTPGRAAVFTYRGLSISLVCKADNRLWLLDSHARDSFGFTGLGQGSAILLMFRSRAALISYLLSRYVYSQPTEDEIDRALFEARPVADRHALGTLRLRPEDTATLQVSGYVMYLFTMQPPQ